jgi:hypothetical protein
VGFCSGERLGVFAVVLCCSYFEFGSIWRSVGLYGVLGAFRLGPVGPVCCTGLNGVKPLSGSHQVSPAGTSLTGGAHRSDWCWSVDSGLVFRCVLGSEVCVLVPRSSGTLVATWAWPTWVVSWRRELEVVFILLEFPSPSRRIFIGSHSAPPLWFSVSVLHTSI